MIFSKNKKTVASEYPWMYVYAACTMSAVVVSTVKIAHAPDSYSSLATFLMFAAVMTYLILSSSRRAVRFVLVLLLVLQVLGLLPVLLKHNYLGTASVIFFLSFEAFLLRQVPRDKPSSRTTVRRVKSEKKNNWNLP